MADRRDVFLGLVAGMSGLAALSQTAAAEASVSTAEAQAAIDAWLEALFSEDPARIGAVLAPEFQILRSDGKSYNKESYLKVLPKYKSRPTSANLTVTGRNDMFVATYEIASEMTINDLPVAGVAPRLSVFRRDGGLWQIAAHANFAQIG